MATKVTASPPFGRKLRRLREKYPKVLKEVEALADRLEADERPGDKVPHLGYDVYKVRLKNPSAGKGKSGGFRVLYYVRVADLVVLLTIYSKSQQENISLEEIRQLIEDYLALDDENEV